MASYKLYAVVLALVCLSFQQEVSCGNSTKQPSKSEPELVDGDNVQTTSVEEYEEYDDEEEENQDHHDECDEYNYKIWNEAFGDPKAMMLANLTLDTIKDMSADEVCSDTIRYVLKTAESLVTSKHAQYSIRMFFKLMWSIGKKLDTESDKYRETSKVIKRVMTDPQVQGLISNFITRGVNLLKDPLVRQRIVKMNDSLAFMFKPYIEKAVADSRPKINRRAASFYRA